MLTQEKWDSFKTYNLSNLSSIQMESNIPHVVINKKKEVKILSESSPPPIIVAETPVKNATSKDQPDKLSDDAKPTSEVFSIKAKKTQFDNYKKTVMYCVLAQREQIRDELYGDTTTKIKFVEKFTFEGIILNTNDFAFVFWTNIEKLTIGSIIYPQDDSKRWWEIKVIDNVPGGYKIACSTSKNTPSFSAENV